MKIVAFGDIHEHINNIGKIKGLSDADCVIITGDLTNVGGIERAKRVIDCVKRYNPNVYVQVGNFDRKEVDGYLIGLGINLHGNGFILEDIGIFGVGGSNLTPFNTPIEYTEKQIEAFIYEGYKKVKDVSLKLFISHAPPFNTRLDVVAGGQHVGSKAVSRFIEKHQPEICITGHIHEAKGKDSIGRTLIINPGTLKNGGYVEIIKEGGVFGAELREI